MRRDFLSRLGRAARWYLPPAEAAEVLEDYREIVEGRSDEELRREVGNPRETVRRLAQPRAYRRWLAVFGILTVCLLLPAVDVVLHGLAAALNGLFGTFFCWGGNGNAARLAPILAPLGAVLSFVWFQCTGRTEQRTAKKSILLPLLVLLGMAWAWFIAWALLKMRVNFLRSLFSGRLWILHLTLGTNALIAGTAGMSGLVKARLGDRRWRAMYVWGLTGMLLSVSVWLLLANMALPAEPGWQTPYLMQYLCITAAGLIGTGLSLC